MRGKPFANFLPATWPACRSCAHRAWRAGCVARVGGGGCVHHLVNHRMVQRETAILKADDIRQRHCIRAPLPAPNAHGRAGTASGCACCHAPCQWAANRLPKAVRWFAPGRDWRQQIRTPLGHRSAIGPAVQRGRARGWCRCACHTPRRTCRVAFARVTVCTGMLHSCSHPGKPRFWRGALSTADLVTSGRTPPLRATGSTLPC
jgi:hypothetical protein